MEKRSISGKDILRMDGLLPPTRRLPVCDAVTSSGKKKDKKWSIGGILKRISSIRDYESSSNDEEMVYCTRQPRPRSVLNRKSQNVVLRPVEKSSNKHSNKSNSTNEAAANSADTSNLQKDSTHSRSSDGSLDGPSKKARKSKLKARIEAKRDQICADSSSDEGSRKSCNSLTRYQTENAMQNAQKNSSCNRKSRAARTERYIKRLSRDEGHRFPENLNNIANKRSSLDFTEGNQTFDTGNEPFQPPMQPQRFITPSNSYTFPVQRSIENLRQASVPTSSCQTQSSTDLAKYPAKRYITDLNQNNTYAKPNILRKDNRYVNHEENNYFSSSPVTGTNYARPYDHVRNNQSVHQSSSPPEPPPRDPRCRVFSYSCNSFPFNGKYRVTKYDDAPRTKMDDIREAPRDGSKGLRSYESNNEISWCGSSKQCPRRPLSLTVTPTQLCNLSKCTNNKHKSTGRHVDESAFQETEAMRCRRRNDRNDQLNSSFNDFDVKARGNQPSSLTDTQKIHNNLSSTYNESLDSSYAKLPCKQVTKEHPHNSPNNTLSISGKTERKEEKEIKTSEQEALERRRSSKNLEEALSELEAIYNSLSLGDEDLLDRAERRSMEEFSLRRGRSNDTVGFTSVDSPDRTKDDMAYRRMHPKERPTSLSEVGGQSALSNISYLMASPILSRKDAANNYPYVPNCPVRRDEPDVTRDDVVYRSIHHANNTLKVADPQPPFGIPLGPVTSATESDYLHTTPIKPEHPRSSYIPQCEPDIVTDDLAYRTLRKDANTARNAVESRSAVAKDHEATFAAKKKRAVRSLSANLYGLIDQDRIHLRREPSLQEMKDEMSESVVDIKSLPVRSDYFRRVVSDGELSDYDTRWRTESSLKNSRTDINGNHPVSNVHRKKLRVYVSPSTKVQSLEQKNEDGTVARSSTPPNDILSKALSNEFWQDCLQPRSNESSKKDTESDFTTYSRLCQDLVNLIDGQNDAEAGPIEETANVQLDQSINIDSPNDSKKPDSSSVLRIQTLGSHYSMRNGEDRERATGKEDVERLTESIVNPEEDPEKTDDSAFDFYLRVADENVKLIAEAFSSVADRLRDSRLSQKNSLTSCRSEIETDSTPPGTSTRSSLAYSHDDVNDNLSSSSKTTDILDTVPKEGTPLSVDWSPNGIEQQEAKDQSNIDPELDLSRAVHDLQLAAASLCGHEKEIEQLEALLKRDASDNIPCATNVSITEEGPLLAAENGSVSSNEEKELECGQEEVTVEFTDIKLLSDEHDPDSEGESIEYEDVCELYDIGIARSTGMRFSYVTNLITVMITTYSMVLLACFLALLLATVAAS